MKQVFSPFHRLQSARFAKRITFVLSFLGAGLVSPLLAQQVPAEIGAATEIVKSVELLKDGDPAKLSVGSTIRTEETLATGDDSRGQFEMVDKTTLAVGPNSELWLDKFVYDPNPSKREVVVFQLRGALRFLTGDNPSETYKIKTPTATIGVRGTQFDVHINGDGETIVALLDGRVNVCRSAGQAKRTNQAAECLGLQQPGRFLVVKKQGRLRLYNKLPKELLGQGGFASAFPFLGGRFRLRGKMAAKPIVRQNIRQYAGLPLEARQKPKRKAQTRPNRKKVQKRDTRKRRIVNTRTPRRVVPARVRPRAVRPQYQPQPQPRDRVAPRIPIQIGIGIGITPGRKRPGTHPETGYPRKKYPHTGPTRRTSPTLIPGLRINPTIIFKPKRTKVRKRTTQRTRYPTAKQRKKSKKQRRRERNKLRQQRLNDTRH